MQTTKVKSIEKRLLQKAAEIWEVEEEKIKDFDPLVQLLIGACASELVRIYNVLEDADALVLERLAQITLPEVMVGPKPGHSVIYAAPTIAQTWLRRGKSRVFVSNHKNTQLEEGQDVYFSPARDTQLWQGGIQRMAIGNQLYDLSHPKNRTALLTAATPLPVGEIWLGLQLPKALPEEMNIPLYFQSKESSKDFFALLPMSKWQTEKGDPIVTTEGLPQITPLQDIDTAFKDLHQLEQEVLHFYNRHYLSLQLGGLDLGTSPYPEALTTHFAEAELQEEATSLVWLKANFSTAIPPTVLDNMLVAMNTVPVINRYLETRKHPHLRKGINVLALDTEQQFLAIESISNDTSTEYTVFDAPTLRRQQEGTYALRRGRMTKMDKRAAYEFLDYVTDLVRDERMAFQALDRTELSKGLQQIESWLELFLNSAGHQAEVPSFLVVYPFKTDERLYVDFWTTVGALANSINSGADLSLETGDDIQTDSLCFLQDVKGGRNRPSFHERLHIFKSAFLSRDRIVTKEDIKALCFKELGTWINSVQVTTGYTAGEGPKTGILKVIQVGITPALEFTNSDALDFPFLANRMEQLLDSKSAGFMPFEVQFINRN